MTTRKRVGGGFKIVHTELKTSELENRKVDIIEDHNELENWKENVIDHESVLDNRKDDNTQHKEKTNETDKAPDLDKPLRDVAQLQVSTPAGQHAKLPEIETRSSSRVSKDYQRDKDTYDGDKENLNEKKDLETLHTDEGRLISFPEIETRNNSRDTKYSDRQRDIVHLPVISPDKSVSLVSSRDGTEKTDLSTEKEKVHREFTYSDHPILYNIQNNVIGHDLVIKGPYGEKPVCYCDYTASGRNLSFIEDFIHDNVCPSYANTHSSTGHNARQTTKFREEARNIIRQCVNANKDDVVIFTGSGATSAIHKVIWALRINQPRVAEETVVFIGPYEHHSNILPWREFGTQTVRIKDDRNGMVDLHQLQTELKFWKEKRRYMLVCMSAASNVTGIITDVDSVSKIAHKYGALVVYDYAAGGPYLDIDMNPPMKNSYKDAIILSPHKFVGGPGTPGLLIAKRWIFKNSVPDRVGGGTVRFVTRETHAYVGHIEEKEEGGTPAIIESIRAGMVFQLKREIGLDVITRREEDLCQRAFARWEDNPCIHVLGSHSAPRVPIFSFLTLHSITGKLIHHNFISTLLSDLYGIQARGGCACAGPYAEDLMGISEPTARRYLWFLSDKAGGQDNTHPRVRLEIMKPGFTRINLAYFYEDNIIDFVIEAIDMVTKHGWKLLPEYTFDCETGSWMHKDFSNLLESRLNSLPQVDVSLRTPDPPKRASSQSMSLKVVLQRSQTILTQESPRTYSRVSSASRLLREYLPRDKRGLRWFLTPQEAMNILRQDNDNIDLNRKKYKLPFRLQATPKRAGVETVDTIKIGSLVTRSDRSDNSSSNSDVMESEKTDRREQQQRHKHLLNKARRKRNTLQLHVDNKSPNQLVPISLAERSTGFTPV